MKVSLNWLREYVDYEGNPDELAELLTMAGVEVEGVETRGLNLDKVVVAQILSREQHPNADRLGVCRVDDGSGQPPRQIVCGATNYKAGDKVPLALPGSVLPGDVKIKVGKLRGVESEGMLCSAKELRLSDDAEGLLILSPDAPLGAPIGSLYPSDMVFDLEITPNRPDLLSHVGLAREVAALSGRTLKDPVDLIETPEGGEPHAHLNIMIAANARAACPIYTARLIDGVKVGPSPDWLRARLETVGIRSINNVVDITNFVMLGTRPAAARLRRGSHRHNRPRGPARQRGRRIARPRRTHLQTARARSRHRPWRRQCCRGVGGRHGWGRKAA